MALTATLVVFLGLLLSIVGSPAQAGTPSSARGQIELTLRGGGRGPLVLEQGPREPGGSNTWSGDLLVVNVGDEPLTVSRVAIRGDVDDVRSPSHLSVRFADGAPTTATLAPGASKDVIVSYLPDKNPRVTQAFGHVVVTSSDERAGEVAMGFRVQLPTGLGWIGEHALSLLVVCPLTIGFVVLAMRFAGRRNDPIVPRASVALSLLELLLAGWAYRRFAPDVGRIDGNDGFQLVERSVWIRSLGAEWYLGVDGSSIMLVLLAATVGLLAVMIAGEARRSDAYYTAFGLLSSGVVGVLVSLDMVLLFAAWATVVFAMTALVGGWGGAGAHRAAAKCGVMGAIGSVALLLAIAALAAESRRSFLVDGTAIAHTTSIPELARTSFASKPAILGIPFVDAVWVMLLVAAGVATPVAPLHAWLADAIEEAPAGAGIAIASIVVALGPYLLLRVGVGGLSDGAHWAGSPLAAFGGVGAAWGAFGAMAQRDLRRFAAYTVVANGGLCLYGLGAMTAQGMTGAVMALSSHGLAAAMILGVANALERRVATRDALRLQGLARDAPVLGALLAAGLGLSIGVPGLAGMWAVVLTMVGGLARHPWPALLLAGALVVSVAAHARVARLFLFEALDPEWRRSKPLAAFRGRLPDATLLEMLGLVPLAALAFALGLWPAPVLAPMEAAARDSAVLAPPTP